MIKIKDVKFQEVLTKWAKSEISGLFKSDLDLVSRHLIKRGPIYGSLLNAFVKSVSLIEINNDDLINVRLMADINHKGELASPVELRQYADSEHYVPTGKKTKNSWNFIAVQSTNSSDIVIIDGYHRMADWVLEANSPVRGYLMQTTFPLALLR